MLDGRSTELLAALRRTFPRWDCTVDGDHVQLTHSNIASPHRPPRRQRDWADTVAVLARACATAGVPTGPTLPLSGLGDAELTFSAVQALDPLIKHRLNHTHSRGFIAQPVVRFTGDRDPRGDLLPGYATSFVNISIVEPIHTIVDHTTLIDTWISALSAVGVYARHLTISGQLTTWCRGPVDGITLKVHHHDHELGDAVLLWNRDDPSKIATDIGSGLERLTWLLSGRPWNDVVYGRLSATTDATTLDAIRTTTLIVGSGIRPAARGASSAVRRLLRGHQAELGMSRVVRWAHAYWSTFDPLPMPWPEVCRLLDAETTPNPLEQR